MDALMGRIRLAYPHRRFQMTARLGAFLLRVESGAEKVVARALGRLRSRTSASHQEAAASVDADRVDEAPIEAVQVAAVQQAVQLEPVPVQTQVGSARGITQRVPGASAPSHPGASVSNGAAASPVRDPELPVSYGRSRVVVLAIDPHHVHAYWEITPGDAAAARETLGRSSVTPPTWVLRFHDVTRVAADTSSAHGYFDIEIDPDARNWYIDLWSPDKTYLVELGLRLSSDFSAVSRANPVTVPPAELSLPTVPEWRTADPERATTHPVAASDPRLPAAPAIAAAPQVALERAPGLAWAFPPGGDVAAEQPWVRASRELDAQRVEAAPGAEAALAAETPPARASTPHVLTFESQRAMGAPATSIPVGALHSRSVSLPGLAAGSGGSSLRGGDSRE